MGRRARSSVVVLSRRRKQKGGSKDELKKFEDEDMTWKGLSAIFIGRLTGGKKTYEMKCDSGSLNIDEGKACKTNIPALKLRLDDLTETLTFYLTGSGKALLEWKLNRGILTLREDLLISPGYYGNNSVENKIVKLIQWAIESIDQYYPEKHKGSIDLKTCRVIDLVINQDTKEYSLEVVKEKSMAAFLNDDLRARYKCNTDAADAASAVCDVSFGVLSPKASSAKVSPSKEIQQASPSLRSAPRSASQLTLSFSPTPSPSNNTSSGIRILSPAKHSAIPLAKPPATQAKPAKPSAKPAKPSAMQAKPARTARKQEEPTEVPRKRWMWLPQLFTKKNTGDAYK